jgi:N-acetyl-alpha-D-muramate 1-phosphate uridylyltransferase
MKAMIFAAGLGTRFKPWTDHHPKALAMVNGKSLLQRNIEYLRSFGIVDIVVNVHHFAAQVQSAIDLHRGWGSRISISDEQKTVLETGGGLQKAAWFFDQGPFLVINADILTDLNLDDLVRFHRQQKPLVTLAVTDRPSSRYFLFDEGDRLCGWRNNKTGEEKIVLRHDPLSEKAFSGIHLISPELFPLIRQKGKFSIVDAYLDLISTETILAFDHSGSRLIDVGKPEAVAEAERLFP